MDSMKDMTVVIVERHDDILNIIDSPINNLVNFDWHADYPLYGHDVIDADFFVKQIHPAYYEQNWVAILASRGMMKNYMWIFPHEYANNDVKMFKSDKGDCRALNIRFYEDMKIYSDCVTIDMDFFGNKIPVDWSPDDRYRLMRNVLKTLVGDHVMMIISVSRSYVNYDVDEFLEEELEKISEIRNLVDIE